MDRDEYRAAIVVTESLFRAIREIVPGLDERFTEHLRTAVEALEASGQIGASAILRGYSMAMDEALGTTPPRQ